MHSHVSGGRELRSMCFQRGTGDSRENCPSCKSLKRKRWGQNLQAKMDAPGPLWHIHLVSPPTVLILSSPEPSVHIPTLGHTIVLPKWASFLPFPTHRTLPSPKPQLPKTPQKSQSWASPSPSLKRLGLMGSMVF